MLNLSHKILSYLTNIMLKHCKKIEKGLGIIWNYISLHHANDKRVFFQAC